MISDPRSTRQRLNHRDRRSHFLDRFSVVLVLFVCWCGAANGQTMEDINPRVQPAMPVNRQLTEANGLRVIEGKHITIFTDVPTRDSIDQLPAIFDAAVPQWCEYFEVDVETTKPWKMQAFLIRDKERFEKANLIPDDLPKFPAGINRGHEIWFFVQPDDYYTRHLLLHEGTHAFMIWFGNGLGAPWYAEGMAELLGLHRWSDGELKIHHRITASTESEGWGRPRLIKRWVAANANGKNNKMLQDVLLTPNRAFGNVESYAWAWAMCEFLNQHPLAKNQFPELLKNVHRSPIRFNRKFQSLFGEQMSALERDWAMFVREMEYGYSVSRAAMTELLREADGSFSLKVDRSWQYLAKKVAKGEKYRIAATGRFEIGRSLVEGQAKPWMAEANGITIDYFRGRPIGELQACVLPQGDGAILPQLCQQDPLMIGVSNVITADIDGLLCFRINESPANLNDNRGQLKLAIEKVE